MAQGFILTERDHQILKELIQRERNRPLNSTNKPYAAEELGDTPDIYIARTPASGIAGLDEGADTGTSSITGTATTNALRDDVASYADCEIYRLLEGHEPQLIPAGFVKRIYNLSTIDIPAWKWVVVNKDKFGYWIIQSAPGSEPSLTVEDSTGTPSYAGISTLQIQTHPFGLSLSQIDTTTVEVDWPKVPRVVAVDSAITTTVNLSGTTDHNAIYVVDITTANVTVNLPSGSSYLGYEVLFLITGSGNNVVTVVATGGENIDSTLLSSVKCRGGLLRLRRVKSTGTAWASDLGVNAVNQRWAGYKITDGLGINFSDVSLDGTIQYILSNYDAVNTAQSLFTFAWTTNKIYLGAANSSPGGTLTYGRAVASAPAVILTYGFCPNVSVSSAGVTNPLLVLWDDYGHSENWSLYTMDTDNKMLFNGNLICKSIDVIDGIDGGTF